MAAFTVNVRLPAPRCADAGAPALTRFQSDAAPAWAGVTLLDVPAWPTDTVADLKRRVAGARAAPFGVPRARARKCGARRGHGATWAMPRRDARAPRARRLASARARAMRAACARIALTSARARRASAPERSGGAVPEALRRGGGAGKGVLLADSDTLEACGLGASMGMWEARRVAGALAPRARSSALRAFA
jgi:hypothetical protein